MYSTEMVLFIFENLFESVTSGFHLIITSLHFERIDVGLNCCLLFMHFCDSFPSQFQKNNVGSPKKHHAKAEQFQKM